MSGVYITVLLCSIISDSVYAQQSSDSVGVAYENGELKLPDAPKDTRKVNSENVPKHKLPATSKDELQSNALEDAHKKHQTKQTPIQKRKANYKSKTSAFKSLNTAPTAYASL